MSITEKIVKLEQVCSLIPGAASGLYTSANGSDQGDAFLLKGVNLNQEGGFSLGEAERVELIKGKKTDKYFLKEGDVVVMARGSGIRSGIISQVLSDKSVIASANFITIRPNTSQISGVVIAAYLNSESGLNKLRSLSVGATIPHITQKSLRSLEIPVPTKANQSTIENLFYVSKEAYLATLDLAEQQKRATNALIANLLMEAS